jgi:hypothetical protein
MSKKRLAIVAGHFPPSNLAGVHRARLWAHHLPDFGWEPIIVTAHWKYYEEQLDPALSTLVDPKLRIIRTKAISTSPIRLVGDIGLRAFYWHFKALDELIVRDEIDFVHITIPSNYSSLLGELLYRRHRIPFGIDYIDPWVSLGSGEERFLSKAWLSSKLAGWLEPWAVKHAALITGVAPLYYKGVLARNPGLHDGCVTAAMPYGNSDADFRLLAKLDRKTFLFPRDDGLFHMIYAGAMLPQAYVVLERLLQAIALLRDSAPDVMQRLRIHFVGTGTSPDNPDGYNIRPYVERFGLEPWIREYPARISYVDVLNHLTHASATLVLGSTEAHYTPSKIYQAVQARRPVFALLHESSTAVTALHESGAGTVVTFTDNSLPRPAELASILRSFVRDPQYSPDAVNWASFDAYSARNSTRVLVDAVENALELFNRRDGTQENN